jgi:hypothetical protein
MLFQLYNYVLFFLFVLNFIKSVYICVSLFFFTLVLIKIDRFCIIRLFSIF